MKVLVLNCGSSSIKYQLFDITNDSVMAKGVVEKIGLKGSFLKHVRSDDQKVRLEGDILDHRNGIEYVLGVLISPDHGCIKSLDEINAVGHRVAHGGEKFSESVFITDDVLENIKDCIQLAPLHNPHNLRGIYAIRELLNNVKQVAVFDTAFHQTMPDYAYMYAIPNSLYKKYGIRRYGFHGTSYRYVAAKACEHLEIPMDQLKIIACHLGNGASMVAIDKGKSVDTSMGLTPIEGLIMGTRSGDLDLGVLTFIMDKEEIGLTATNTLINKQSGVLGVSSVSSDMREIEKAAAEGDKNAALALNMFNYRVLKYIGAYAAAMNGVDLIIFTGGIGENAPEARESICKRLTYLGLEFDDSLNQGNRGMVAEISKQGSRVRAMVVPTNEELVIAQDTYRIISELN